MKKKQLSHLLCAALLSAYLLGVHEGKVALWKGDDPQPCKVFPYYAANLPKEARRQLEAGIPIESVDELRRLAELYLS